MHGPLSVNLKDSSEMKLTGYDFVVFVERDRHFSHWQKAVQRCMKWDTSNMAQGEPCVASAAVLWNWTWSWCMSAKPKFCLVSLGDGMYCILAYIIWSSHQRNCTSIVDSMVGYRVEGCSSETMMHGHLMDGYWVVNSRLLSNNVSTVYKMLYGNIQAILIGNINASISSYC